MRFPSFSHWRPAAILAVFALLLGGCHKSAPNPTPAAQQFFILVSSGKFAEAYEATTFSFRALQTETAFEANCRDLKLTSARSLDLGAPEIQGRSAKMTGDLQIADGTSLKLIVKLEEERGAWRVSAVTTPRSLETGESDNRFTKLGRRSEFGDPASLPMPDEKTLKHMTQTYLLAFNQAVRERSFADFYETVAEDWKKELTEKQLQRAFQGFIDRGLDITAISNEDPIFDTPPQINGKGYLVLQGHYNTKPNLVLFDLKFTYELPEWKLYGIDLKLVAPAAP